jgi:hypothetical protein
VCTENLIPVRADRIIYYRSEMIALMCFSLRLFTLPLKSKIRLEAENAILRHQLIVLERKIRGRVRFTNGDRLFFIWSIVGFPQCWMRFGSSDPRPWCGGTVSVFDVTGVGSPDRQNNWKSWSTKSEMNGLLERLAEHWLERHQQ